MTENPDSRMTQPDTDSTDDRSTGSRSINSSVGKNTGRLQLALVILVFLSPWLFAVLWKSSGRINHGTLIEPPQPLPDVVLAADAGLSGSVEDFRGKWSWVVLAQKACTDLCVEKLDLLRQVRIAQKKNIKRLRYILAIVDPLSDDMQTLVPGTIADSHPDLVIRIIQSEEHGQFLTEFVENSNDDHGPYDKIFVVDPLGNLMMVYLPDSEAKHLHRDMARLLKASHVG